MNRINFAVASKGDKSRMLALAIVIIACDLQPEELESAAHQLAEYNAVTDANTEIKECCE